MNGTTLRKLASDPAAFRDQLLIDVDGTPTRFGDVIEPWQRADLEALDPAWQAVTGRAKSDKPHVKRAWLERPRGHSKSGDVAVMATWALFASARMIRGNAGAGDRDQARVLGNGIGRLVSLNPWLAAVLDVQNYRVVNKKTGSELEIISSDAATSFGLLPDFILCDEVSHWLKPDLWHSLVSASAKRKNCILACILNAGFQDSWQWHTREAIIQDPAWYFSRLDGPRASWITPDRLAEQARLLPHVAYARLWLNQWTQGAGDALTPDDIDRSVTMPYAPEPEPGFTHVGGLDLGISRDRASFAVLGKHVGYTKTITRDLPRLPFKQAAMVDLGLMQDPRGPEFESEIIGATHRVRLQSCQSWKPPKNGKVQIEPIEQAILDAHRRYGLQAVLFDPYQAQYLAQRLLRQGVPMIECHFVAGNLQQMATNVIEAFNQNTIDLYPDQDLIRDLKRLRVEERSYGFRLTSPRDSTGHGDRATAFTLALLAAQRYGHPVPTVNGPLVYDLPIDLEEESDQWTDNLLLN